MAELAKQRKEIRDHYNQFIKDPEKQVCEKGYRYCLGKGNNHLVVQRVLMTRASWLATPPAIATSLFDFRWSSISNYIKFDQLAKHGQKSLVNHFEFHHCISNKDQLFANLSKACELSHKDVQNFMPITFTIDHSNKYSVDAQLEHFQICFNTIERNAQASLDGVNQQLAQLQNIKPSKKSLNLRPCMFEGHNMWLIKPSDYNRGRGVQVFNTLDDFRKLAQETLSGQ